MTDTVRTRADLIANLFQDAQPANSITPQDMRDFIVSSSSRGGWADYNDLTTASTAITVSASTETYLTNDGAGANSQNRLLVPGLTDVWDVSTNSFDWSDLALYDWVDIRLDIEVTTSAANQEVYVNLEMASGDASEYDLQIANTAYKVAAAHPVTAYHGVYMGSTAVLNNPTKIKIFSPDSCTVKVNGWAVRIERY